MILELILEVYILHIASKKTCGVTLEDDKVIEILAKEVKQCNLMLEFEKGNRQDLVDQNKSDIEILLGYLPQQLSEEDILRIVKEQLQNWVHIACKTWVNLCQQLDQRL